MLVDHQTLTEGSRVFIFPSSRKFYEQEIGALEESIRDFCTSIPGIEMGFKITYGRFIIIFVSEETPLGLEENDQLIRFIQKLEADMDLLLLDRMNVCYKQGEFVQRKEMPEFKKMIKSRSVSPNTIVFDNTVSNKAAFDSSWELPASDSWLSHLFRKR